MSQTVVLKVRMSCQGCVGAVRRVLEKTEGVDSFDINIEQQKVTVVGNLEPTAVFQTVSKTGKMTSFWEEETPEPAPELSSTAASAPGSAPAEAAESAKPAEAVAAA